MRRTKGVSANHECIMSATLERHNGTPRNSVNANTWNSRFSRGLLTSADENYEAARRIWNGMVDRRPALIARCVTPHDVRTAVKLARSEGLPLSVGGGGHSVAGTAVCEDGLMIDLPQ